jgi:hypothetical protein
MGMPAVEAALVRTLTRCGGVFGQECPGHLLLYRGDHFDVGFYGVGDEALGMCFVVEM